MLYKINQNTFHLKEGQAIFGNANALHAGHMYQDQDCQYIPITFDPKLIYGFSGSLLFQKYTEPILRSFSLSAVPLDLSCKWHSEAIKISVTSSTWTVAGNPCMNLRSSPDCSTSGRSCMKIRSPGQLFHPVRMKKTTAASVRSCPISQNTTLKRSS